MSAASGTGAAGASSPADPTRPAGTTRPPSSTPTSRSARRRARSVTVVHQESFVERYRTILLAALVIVGVGVIALVFYQSASAKPYICNTLLTPGPVDTLPPATPAPAVTPSPSPSASPTGAPTVTPSAPATSPSPAASPDATGSVAPSASVAAPASPAASPSPEASPSASAAPSASASPSASLTPVPEPTIRLGFTTKDLGRTHVANGSTVTYDFCPPTSGNHFSVAGQAPLPRAFYGPDTTLRPGNWVHNMEHGYVVIAYQGTPDQATIDSIKHVMDTAPGDAFAQQCGLPNRVIAVRFDSMDTPFAVLAWDRALLLPEWDEQKALTFASQWQDGPAIPENPATGNGIC